MAKKLLVNDEMLLYGDVGDPFGWGDGFTPSDVAEAMAEHGPGDMTVRINSGGGIAFDGMAIYSLLKSHQGKVTTMVDGVAASAASLIAMAGAERKMRTGAMLMIHDPSAVTIGPAKAHEDSAAKLHKLADNYANVYAQNAGKDAKSVRDMMLATTWMDADAAIKEGFATAKADEEAVALAAFDYRLYPNSPKELPLRKKEAASVPRTHSPAAVAAAEKEPIMAAKETVTAADDKPVVEMKADAKVETKTSAPVAKEEAKTKNWAAGFYASAGSLGIELKALNDIVASSETHDQAKDKLIDALAAAKNRDKPAANGGHVSVGMEEGQKFVMGATKSLIGKIAMFNQPGKMSPDGEHNEFSGLMLRELARMSLERAGVKNIAREPMAMIAQALQPVYMAGAHSTSDFTNILANVANKSMLKGYEEAPETFNLWTASGTLTDFKTATRVDTGLFPSLAEVEEGAEYTYASMSDRKAQLVLATYGKMFAITRQAIINDDLNAFSKVPGKMGTAAKRTIGTLVWAILTGNANAPDNVALFHASHSNLDSGGGTALSADSLDAGRVKMAKQKDPDSIAKTGLGIRPAYLLVPVALQGKAHQLMTSQAEPGQDNPNVANRVANMAQVIADQRLDDASATAWYLAANQSQYDTIEVSYLNGVQAPTLEQRDGWNVDGVEFKVRIDAGVTLLDYRGFYKAAGA